MKDLQKIISQYQGQGIGLEIIRGRQTKIIHLVPRQNHPSDEGAMGVVLTNTIIQKYPWYIAVWLGIKSTFYLHHKKIKKHI